jgi:hypothetical protein
MNKEGKITCKTCQQRNTIILRNKEEIKEFREYKKGFNCKYCAFKFWDKKIANGEIILEDESLEFQQKY